jgi:WD40 repeat protein
MFFCIVYYPYIRYKYDINKNFLVHTFDQHKDSTRNVVFNDAGNLLLSSSSDKSIKIADIKKKKNILNIKNAHKYFFTSY